MKTGKLILYPSAIALAYATDCLLDHLKQTIELTKTELISKISILKNSSRINQDAFAQDDYIDDIQKIQKKIEKSIDSEGDELYVAACILFFGKKLFKFSKSQLKKSIKNLRQESKEEKKDLDEILKSFVSSNKNIVKFLRRMFLFKTIEIIEDGFRSDDDLKRIEEKIDKFIDSSEISAKLIGKDEISKLHYNYFKYKLIKLNAPDYIWVTTGKNSVRPSHRALNQKICNWEDVSVYKNRLDDKWKKKSSIGGVQKQVGEDYNCQCGFIPILPDFEESEE